MENDDRGDGALPLQERVFSLLKREIVNCERLPGSVICEEELVEKFRTSRTPIREALLKLQREGLVEIFPRQGTFVSEISLKDIYEIYQLRLIIEPQVIKIACHNLDAGSLTAYRNFFIGLETRECTSAEWFRMDRELHCYIVSGSGNKHLRKIFDTIMDQNLRIRMIAGKITSRIQSTTREHINILDALLAGDAGKAAELVTAHITASRDAALKLESLL
jgi:DNA-binding GntR family transcriptional regulator